jgi:uncharacterized membrane protein
MFGMPLHPILVHFPVVLSILLPPIILIAWLASVRTTSGRKAWVAVTVFHALLLASTFAAVQTGEEDEERVEKALASEDPLETHEEKGEFLLKVTGASLLVTALGLAPGMLGLAGKALGSLASLSILFLAIQTGHSGGKLVYQHGAAAAFATPSAASEDSQESMRD